MKRPVAAVAGTGRGLPKHVMTNHDFASIGIETSHEWIMERSGISERRLAKNGETTCSMASEASRRAMEAAGVHPGEIDVIVLSTATPDRLLPATDVDVQAELGATRAAAFDVGAACAGWLYAMSTAEGLIMSGTAETALVIGSEKMSAIVDWTDRSTCVLFGDGAGAVVIERVPERGFLAFELGADGAGGIDLQLPAGGSRNPTTAETVARGQHYVEMNGRQVFKFATRVLVSSAKSVLARSGLSVEDVDVYVPHQANVRIIDHAVAKLGIPEDRVVVNVDRYGNTSSASIPLALGDAVAEGRVHAGATVLMTGMGAGLTWGSAIVRWTEAS